jgi:hypothetical protein
MTVAQSAPDSKLEPSIERDLMAALGFRMSAAIDFIHQTSEDAWKKQIRARFREQWKKERDRRQ